MELYNMWGFPVGSVVKNLPVMQEETQEMQVRLLGWDNPLEKEMATHSSILAWEITRTEEPGGLHTWGRKELDSTEENVSWRVFLWGLWEIFLFRKRGGYKDSLRLSGITRSLGLQGQWDGPPGQPYKLAQLQGNWQGFASGWIRRHSHNHRLQCPPGHCPLVENFLKCVILPAPQHSALKLVGSLCDPNAWRWGNPEERGWA